MMPLKKPQQTSNAAAMEGSLAQPNKWQSHNTTIKPKIFPAQVQQELMTMLSEREELEQKLSKVDETIYDLESVFLKQCVSLGGSLFDGYGPERRSLLHKGIKTVYASTMSSPGSPASVLASPIPTCSISHDDSRYAFRSRLRSFTPIERIFSTSSVGTLGRVERMKSLRTVRTQYESSKSHYSRTRYRVDCFASQSQASTETNAQDKDSPN